MQSSPPPLPFFPAGISPRNLLPARQDIGITPETIQRAESPSTKMLLALAATGKHVYGGTVAPGVKAERRAANKRARTARRAHR